MLTCKCNEPCFYFIKTIEVNEDGIDFIQKIHVNKCSRQKVDNEKSKKKPCDFYSEVIFQQEEYKSLDKENSKIKDAKKSNIIYEKDIIDNINRLCKYYHVGSTNLFGLLNKNLQLLGYYAHDPTTETFTELKYRLSKPPIKRINNIYMNKEAFSSGTLLQYTIDPTWDPDFEEKLFKAKPDSKRFEWTDDLYKSGILVRPQTKNKKKRKNKIFDSEIIQNEDEDINGEEEKEEKEEKEGEEGESDEESEATNDEKDKDNEFDMEAEVSDDDDGNDGNDYDDFSD